MSEAGAKATLQDAADVRPEDQSAEIDLSETWTNEFVKKAHATYK